MNLKVKQTTYYIKEKKIITSAEEFCCEPMRRAWDRRHEWIGDESIICCPFCGQPIIHLPNEEREIVRAHRD